MSSNEPIILSERSADINGVYRYQLWRAWEQTRGCVTWVMLNPSVADELQDDRTLRRCISFTRSWSYGAVRLVNVFAYRSTRPEKLLQVADPIGPENDTHIVQVARAAEKVIVAWGGWGKLLNRDQEVLRILRQTGKPLYCLGQTKDGSPRHPLYRPSNTPLLPYF